MVPLICSRHALDEDRDLCSVFGKITGRQIVASAANSQVFLFAPDHLDFCFGGEAAGEVGIFAAARHAYSTEFGDVLGQRNERQNLTKRVPLKGAVQCCHYDRFAFVRPLSGPLNYVWELANVTKGQA